MLERIKNILRCPSRSDAKPLAMDGVSPAPLTQEPDEAEQAAEALMDLLSGKDHARNTKDGEPQQGSVEYYRHIAENIRNAREASRRRVTRFLAYCERQLQDTQLPISGPRSLSLLEMELYKRIDTIDREGGELKRRWQHCLAEVTVRRLRFTGDSGEESHDASIGGESE